MDEKIKHMGMEVTKDEHKKWHEKPSELTAEEHKELMEKMEVSEEEDKKWHQEHDAPQSAPKKSGKRTVNPFAIGGGFLDYCIRQGWLIQEGKARGAKYYITNEGEEGLKKFGIQI